MCVVSMIGDHYRDKFTNPQQWPGLQPYVNPGGPSFVLPSPVARDEFEALKREVEEMKALLRRAKMYDEKNGEPDCQKDEKVALLRKVAHLCGVELDDVLGAE